MNLRVLLADDHRVFAAGLAALIGKEPDLEVVAIAEDGREAVRSALELAPDVVAMDLSMPRLSGIEATRQIVAERPETKVLCLSMHRERQYLQAALEAGAVGYVLKDHPPETVIQAVHCVAGGRICLCPEMAAAAVEEYRACLVGHKPAVDPVLSAREHEVLQLVAEGATSHEIAVELFLSERTVASHRRHLSEKLGIHSVAGLTKYAIRHGLTTVERDRRDLGPSES